MVVTFQRIFDSKSRRRVSATTSSISLPSQKQQTVDRPLSSRQPLMIASVVASGSIRQNWQGQLATVGSLGTVGDRWESPWIVEVDVRVTRVLTRYHLLKRFSLDLSEAFPDPEHIEHGRQIRTAESLVIQPAAFAEQCVALTDQLFPFPPSRKGLVSNHAF